MEKSPQRRPSADADTLADLVDLVHNVSRDIRSRGYGDAPVIRLTSSEGNIMRFIDRNPDISPSEVARVSGYQRSNLSAVLKSLEAKGLIERRPDQEDFRQTRLFPTALAGENLRRMRAVWSEMIDTALGGDTAGLVETLALLQRLEHGFIAQRMTPTRAAEPLDDFVGDR
jgi:DNA-binding MarR family transcriptional regulator